jgi:hypothetical protein
MGGESMALWGPITRIEGKCSDTNNAIHCNVGLSEYLTIVQMCTLPSVWFCWSGLLLCQHCNPALGRVQ